jgi:glycosyltransferase involved in cell wall biosynthesis
MKRLRVAIDARLTSGEVGGVEQVVIGLARGLSALADGDEEYLFLAYSDASEWIKPYLRGPCKLYPVGTSWRLRTKRRIRAAYPWFGRAWDQLISYRGAQAIHIPVSNGTVEKMGANVVHFPVQLAFRTAVPSIYHPHDLQHLHMPELFSPWLRSFREVTYRAFCNQASMVAVSSSWVKRDLIQHYGLDSNKVQIVPLAPPLEAYDMRTGARFSEIQNRFSLPPAFVFYPAQTWPHKNHIGLLEALALLRDRSGVEIPLVSSGRQNDHFPLIQQRVHELGLAGQVHFLGYISTQELYGLYRLCRAVVIPTMFEAASFPMWEAFHAGAPVACSNVTSLPEQGGGAVLIFDPATPEDMAVAIERLWGDEALRETLVQRGREILVRFSWTRTARLFRAHYRRIADRVLSDEDRALIEAPPIL